VGTSGEFAQRDAVLSFMGKTSKGAEVGDDPFFEFGGHFLPATRPISHACAELGTEIPDPQNFSTCRQWPRSPRGRRNRPLPVAPGLRKMIRMRS
jgi:hypothetical protein